MTEPVRLAKRLAELLPCSRREAEQYIEGGWVTVDGVVVEEPHFRVQNQQVALTAGATLQAPVPVTMLFHKPAGLATGWGGGDEPLSAGQVGLSVASRSPEDRLHLRPLRRHFSGAVLLTPLATPASGLIVFSDDWRVARKLREQASEVEHEVVVEVSGQPREGGLERLNRADHGFTWNGLPLPSAKVSWQNEKRLRFALNGERPGQIAYLCESIGLRVEGMKRMRISRVPLSPLQPGQWRYLQPHERF